MSMNSEEMAQLLKLEEEEKRALLVAALAKDHTLTFITHTFGKDKEALTLAEENYARQDFISYVATKFTILKDKKETYAVEFDDSQGVAEQPKVVIDVNHQTTTQSVAIYLRPIDKTTMTLPTHAQWTTFFDADTKVTPNKATTVPALNTALQDIRGTDYSVTVIDTGDTFIFKALKTSGEVEELTPDEIKALSVILAQVMRDEINNRNAGNAAPCIYTHPADGEDLLAQSIRAVKKDLKQKAPHPRTSTEEAVRTFKKAKASLAQQASDLYAATAPVRKVAQESVVKPVAVAMTQAGAAMADAARYQLKKHREHGNMDRRCKRAVRYMNNTVEERKSRIAAQSETLHEHQSARLKKNQQREVEYMTARYCSTVDRHEEAWRVLLENQALECEILLKRQQQIFDTAMADLDILQREERDAQTARHATEMAKAIANDPAQRLNQTREAYNKTEEGHSQEVADLHTTQVTSRVTLIGELKNATQVLLKPLFDKQQAEQKRLANRHREEVKALEEEARLLHQEHITRRNALHNAHHTALKQRIDEIGTSSNPSDLYQKQILEHQQDYEDATHLQQHLYIDAMHRMHKDVACPTRDKEALKRRRDMLQQRITEIGQRITHLGIKPIDSAPAAVYDRNVAILNQEIDALTTQINAVTTALDDDRITNIPQRSATNRVALVEALTELSELKSIYLYEQSKYRDTRRVHTINEETRQRLIAPAEMTEQIIADTLRNHLEGTMIPKQILLAFQNLNLIKNQNKLKIRKEKLILFKHLTLSATETIEGIASEISALERETTTTRSSLANTKNQLDQYYSDLESRIPLLAKEIHQLILTFQQKSLEITREHISREADLTHLQQQEIERAQNSISEAEKNGDISKCHRLVLNYNRDILNNCHLLQKQGLALEATSAMIELFEKYIEMLNRVPADLIAPFLKHYKSKLSLLHIEKTRIEGESLHLTESHHTFFSPMKSDLIRARDQELVSDQHKIEKEIDQIQFTTIDALEEWILLVGAAILLPKKCDLDKKYDKQYLLLQEKEFLMLSPIINRTLSETNFIAIVTELDIAARTAETEYQTQKREYETEANSAYAELTKILDEIKKIDNDINRNLSVLPDFKSKTSTFSTATSDVYTSIIEYFATYRNKQSDFIQSQINAINETIRTLPLSDFHTTIKRRALEKYVEMLTERHQKLVEASHSAGYESTLASLRAFGSTFSNQFRSLQESQQSEIDSCAYKPASATGSEDPFVKLEYYTLHRRQMLEQVNFINARICELKSLKASAPESVSEIFDGLIDFHESTVNGISKKLADHQHFLDGWIPEIFLDIDPAVYLLDVTRSAHLARMKIAFNHLSEGAKSRNERLYLTIDDIRNRLKAISSQSIGPISDDDLEFFGNSIRNVLMPFISQSIGKKSSPRIHHYMKICVILCTLNKEKISFERIQDFVNLLHAMHPEFEFSGIHSEITDTLFNLAEIRVNSQDKARLRSRRSAFERELKKINPLLCHGDNKARLKMMFRDKRIPIRQIFSTIEYELIGKVVHDHSMSRIVTLAERLALTKNRFQYIDVKLTGDELCERHAYVAAYIRCLGGIPTERNKLLFDLYIVLINAIPEDNNSLIRAIDMACIRAHNVSDVEAALFHAVTALYPALAHRKILIVLILNKLADHSLNVEFTKDDLIELFIAMRRDNKYKMYYLSCFNKPIPKSFDHISSTSTITFTLDEQQHINQYANIFIPGTNWTMYQRIHAEVAALTDAELRIPVTHPADTWGMNPEFMLREALINERLGTPLSSSTLPAFAKQRPRPSAFRDFIRSGKQRELTKEISNVLAQIETSRFHEAVGLTVSKQSTSNTEQLNNLVPTYQYVVPLGRSAPNQALCEARTAYTLRHIQGVTPNIAKILQGIYVILRNFTHAHKECSPELLTHLISIEDAVTNPAVPVPTSSEMVDMILKAADTAFNDPNLDTRKPILMKLVASVHRGHRFNLVLSIDDISIYFVRITILQKQLNAYEANAKTGIPIDAAALENGLAQLKAELDAVTCAYLACYEAEDRPNDFDSVKRRGDFKDDDVEDITAMVQYGISGLSLSVYRQVLADVEADPSILTVDPAVDDIWNATPPTPRDYLIERLREESHDPDRHNIVRRIQ